MEQVRIALVQMRCEKGDIAANLAAMRAYVREAEAMGVDVVCFPEASITGYVEPARYPEAVLALDDQAVTDVAEMTRKTAITVLAGLIEAHPGGKPYITQLVVRNGVLLGYYRKRTIPDEEAHLYAPAKTAGVFSHGVAPFGITICADIENASLFAEHARGGARVVFEAAAPGLYGEQATRDWASGYAWWRGECHEKLGRYARDNSIYVAVATQAGRTRDEDFPGGGYVFGPDGACIGETADWREGVLYASLPIAHATRR